MHKFANAFLTKKYNQKIDNFQYGASDSINIRAMRQIEIKTKMGKPLVVLQSEDSPIEIEKTLRENGWNITSWKKNLLLLESNNDLQNQGLQSYTTKNPNKIGTNKNFMAGSVGCLIIFIIMIVCFASCSASISQSMSENKSKPETSTFIDAEVMCESFVKRELNAPSTAKFSRQETKENIDKSNSYIAIGFVESENRLGGVDGSNYRCDISYDPKTDLWSSKTLI